MNSDDNLIDAIKKAAHDWIRSQSKGVTIHDLNEMEARIMSAISDFVAKVTAHNDRVDVAIDGLVGDVDWLVEQIKALQENPGPITPQDQALLDGVETRLPGGGDQPRTLDAHGAPH